MYVSVHMHTRECLRACGGREKYFVRLTIPLESWGKNFNFNFVFNIRTNCFLSSVQSFLEVAMNTKKTTTKEHASIVRNSNSIQCRSPLWHNPDSRFSSLQPVYFSELFQEKLLILYSEGDATETVPTTVLFLIFFTFSKKTNI